MKQSRPRDGKYMDLVGHKYGQLTVVKFSHTKPDPREPTRLGKIMWECVCECGGTVTTSSHSLRANHRRSCGCIMKGRVSPNRGVFGIGVKNLTLTRYRKSAETRSLAFTLTDEEFFAIGTQDCTYCGTGPRKMAAPKTYYGEYYFTGLDRIQSDKGYTLDNVLPCCKDCNYMKQEDSNEQFAQQIVKIHDFWAKKQTEK